jgi:hypothetical protein
MRALPQHERESGQEGPVSRIMRDILDMFHRPK